MLPDPILRDRTSVVKWSAPWDSDPHLPGRNGMLCPVELEAHGDVWTSTALFRHVAVGAEKLEALGEVILHEPCVHHTARSNLPLPVADGLSMSSAVVVHVVDTQEHRLGLAATGASCSVGDDHCRLILRSYSSHPLSAVPSSVFGCPHVEQYTRVELVFHPWQGCVIPIYQYCGRKEVVAFTLSFWLRFRFSSGSNGRNRTLVSRLTAEHVSITLHWNGLTCSGPPRRPEQCEGLEEGRGLEPLDFRPR